MAFFFRTLGPAGLYEDDVLLEPPSAWALLLLAFVVSREEGVSRRELVAQFWPEEDERSARHNLSQFLYRHRQERWLQGLETKPQHLRWLGDSDLAGFRQALADGNWQTAIQLYRDEFLSGVAADHTAELSDWLEQERGELHSLWRDAALSCAETFGNEGRYAEAAKVLEEVMRRDPFAEDALQTYLKIASRDRALAAFDRFEKQLAAELELTPLSATRQLAEALRTQVPKTPPTKEAAAETDEPEQLELPPTEELGLDLTGPLIGRESELAEIDKLFTAECRLLTLTGPGGIGKSRLAQAVMTQHATASTSANTTAKTAANTAFVPLASLSDAAFIVPTVAASLGLNISQQNDLLMQLKTYLQEHEVFLVLDNLEHLPGAADITASLLAAAPTLQILATSREPLGLKLEWLYELRGLSIPEQDDDNLAELYDAVQLFLQRARRAQASFVSQPRRERPAVVRICRLLQGLPLGIELAAAWTRLLTPQELAAELSKNLDLLETQQHDVPERHRSLRVVFEHSWTLLGAAEQEALAGLSLFRGGFSLEAAQAVTNVSLRHLLGLVSKSLLSRRASGRFEMLEPIRHYAAQKLSDNEMARRHADYYRALAEEAESGLRGRDQVSWLKRIDGERGNVRAALAWARAAGEATLGLRLASALQNFWWIRGPYTEGYEALMALLELSGSGKDAERVRAKALHRAGTLIKERGGYQRAAALYHEALELAQSHGDEQVSADALHSLALLASKQGDNAAAFPLFEQALTLQRKLNDRWGVSVTLNNLGVTLAAGGRYQEAKEPLLESLALKRDMAEPQGVAYALNNLAEVYYWLGDRATVQRYAEESLELKRELGDEQGVATSLANLGRIAGANGQLDAARRYFADSIARLASLENEWTLLWVLTALVRLEAEAGACERALKLAGGTEALRDRLGITLPVPNREELARGLNLARNGLGREQATHLLDEGHQMTTQELIHFAVPSDATSHLENSWH